MLTTTWRRRAAWCFAGLLLAAVTLACETDMSPSGVSGAGSSATLNLTGTWSGTVSDTSGQLQMTWRLTQTNRDVTGTVTATTIVGAPVYTGGTVNGTLSGSILSFTVTIPRGSIVEIPNCSITLTGTATDVQPASMSGTYAGSDSCLGAVDGGRLIFVKQ
jgi:hypothetical protein